MCWGVWLRVSSEVYCRVEARDGRSEEVEAKRWCVRVNGLGAVVSGREGRCRVRCVRRAGAGEGIEGRTGIRKRAMRVIVLSW